jgi:hypothetical protein
MRSGRHRNEVSLVLTDPSPNTRYQRSCPLANLPLRRPLDRSGSVSVHHRPSRKLLKSLSSSHRPSLSSSPPPTAYWSFVFRDRPGGMSASIAKRWIVAAHCSSVISSNGACLELSQYSVGIIVVKIDVAIAAGCNVARNDAKGTT